MPGVLTSPRISLAPPWYAFLLSIWAFILLLLNKWRRLSFQMQPQDQTFWCWSALTVSVSRFFNAASAWTQCTLVNDQFGQTTCCVDGRTPACNQGWYPELSLPRTGNLA